MLCLCTEYVYLVTIETDWCSAYRIKNTCLNSANITNGVTIKGHIATEEEIFFFENYEEKKKILAEVKVF